MPWISVRPLDKTNGDFIDYGCSSPISRSIVEKIKTLIGIQEVLYLSSMPHSILVRVNSALTQEERTVLSHRIIEAFKEGFEGTNEEIRFIP